MLQTRNHSPRGLLLEASARTELDPCLERLDSAALLHAQHDPTHAALARRRQ